MSEERIAEYRQKSLQVACLQDRLEVAAFASLERGYSVAIAQRNAACRHAAQLAEVLSALGAHLEGELWTASIDDWIYPGEDDLIPLLHRADAALASYQQSGISA